MRSKTIATLWILAVILIVLVTGVKLGRGLFESRRLPILIKNADKFEDRAGQIILERFGFEKSVLSKKEGSSSWTMQSPVEWPADETAVKDMINVLKTATIEDKVSERAELFADYELDAARGIGLWVKDNGGKTLVAGRIGKQVLGSWDRSYFTLEASSVVYIVKGLPRYQFEKRPDDLRSKVMFSAPKEEIVSLTLEGPTGKPLKLTKAKEAWKVGGKAVNTEKMEAILSVFNRMEANDFANSAEIAEGPKQLGLEPRPKTLKVRLELTGNRSHELAIGNKKETLYLARLSGNSAIWKLAEWKVSPLIVKETDLTASTPSPSPVKKK